VFGSTYNFGPSMTSSEP